MQQAEKISVIDAKAKRSLQEIQQEQEFQEWWELESRRVREEEEATKRLIKASGNGRGRGGKSQAQRGKAKGRENKEGNEVGSVGAAVGTGVERGKASRDVSKASEASDVASPKIPAKPNTPRGDVPRGEGADRGRGRGRGGQRGGRGGIGRGGRGQGPKREGAVAP